MLKTSARDKVESRLSRSRCVENQCQETRWSLGCPGVDALKTSARKQGGVSVVQESILRVYVLKTSDRDKVESRFPRRLMC